MIAPRPDLSLALVLDGLEKMRAQETEIMELSRVNAAVTTMVDHGRSLLELCQNVFGEHGKLAYDQLVKAKPTEQQKFLDHPWTLAPLHSDKWPGRLAGQVGAYNIAPELAPELHPDLKTNIELMQGKLRQISADSVGLQSALQTDAARTHIPNHYRTESMILRSRAPAAFNNAWNKLRIKPDRVTHEYSVDSPPWIEAPEIINPASAMQSMRELENAYAAAIQSQLQAMQQTGITVKSAATLSARADALGLGLLAEQLQQLPTIEQPVAPSRGEPRRTISHPAHTIPGKPELTK